MNDRKSVINNKKILISSKSRSNSRNKSKSKSKKRTKGLLKQISPCRANQEQSEIVLFNINTEPKKQCSLPKSIQKVLTPEKLKLYKKTSGEKPHNNVS